MADENRETCNLPNCDCCGSPRVPFPNVKRRIPPKEICISFEPEQGQLPDELRPYHCEATAQILFSGNRPLDLHEAKDISLYKMNLLKYYAEEWKAYEKQQDDFVHSVTDSGIPQMSFDQRMSPYVDLLLKDYKYASESQKSELKTVMMSVKVDPKNPADEADLQSMSLKISVVFQAFKSNDVQNKKDVYYRSILYFFLQRLSLTWTIVFP